MSIVTIWEYGEFALFCVTGVPEGVEAAGPRRNPALEGQAHKGGKSEKAHNHEGGAKESLELTGRDV